MRTNLFTKDLIRSKIIGFKKKILFYSSRLKVNQLVIISVGMHK